ncbi:metallophosphoesterase [Candidatus Uhrbacteria bacterium]|jgi:uncharacterized protein|nr:metallophosphoesterase [Candidatus Uhrbacteria bacterium]
MEGVPTIPGVWWMFELVIFAFLVGAGALIAELVLSMKLHKKRGLKVVALIVTVIVWSVIFYGSFIEPKMLLVDETQIELDVEGSDGELTVVVVADIHLGPYKKARWAEKVTAQLNEIDADFIVMPGDFIFSKTKDIEMLESHGSIELPVYSVLGNHDHEFGDLEYITEKLQGMGMEVLRNRSIDVETVDGSVDVAGIDDIWYTPSLAGAFEGVDSSTPTILVSHNPDVILEDGVRSADLVISGHTHCGQVRLPWIGAVPPLPTKLGHDYDCGVFDFGDAGQKLFITAGVGETGPRARLFNPPTIDILHISY